MDAAVTAMIESSASFAQSIAAPGSKARALGLVAAAVTSTDRGQTGENVARLKEDLVHAQQALASAASSEAAAQDEAESLANLLTVRAIEAAHELEKAQRAAAAPGTDVAVVVAALAEVERDAEQAARQASASLAVKVGEVVAMAEATLDEAEAAAAVASPSTSASPSPSASASPSPSNATASSSCAGAATSASTALTLFVDTHRNNQIEGKDVTEYGVLVQGDRECRSWHRYTDFRVLHDKIYYRLGLSPRFPCPKALIFTDEHKASRAAELQQYLLSCVAAAGEETLPAALDLFLFTPTNASDYCRSASFSTMTPDWLRTVTDQSTPDSNVRIEMRLPSSVGGTSERAEPEESRTKARASPCSILSAQASPEPARRGSPLGLQRVDSVEEEEMEVEAPAKLDEEAKAQVKAEQTAETKAEGFGTEEAEAEPEVEAEQDALSAAVDESADTRPAAAAAARATMPQGDACLTPPCTPSAAAAPAASPTADATALQTVACSQRVRRKPLHGAEGGRAPSPLAPPRFVAVPSSARATTRQGRAARGHVKAEPWEDAALADAQAELQRRREELKCIRGLELREHWRAMRSPL